MMLATAQAASLLTQVGVSAGAGALVGLERRAAHKDGGVKTFGGARSRARSPRGRRR